MAAATWRTRGWSSWPTPRGRARTSGDFRFPAAVAEFGMLLRGSEHRGRSSLDDVPSLAGGSLGEDPHGHRRAFIRLMEDSRRLPGGTATSPRGRPAQAWMTARAGSLPGARCFFAGGG